MLFHQRSIESWPNYHSNWYQHFSLMAIIHLKVHLLPVPRINLNARFIMKVPILNQWCPRKKTVPIVIYHWNVKRWEKNGIHLFYKIKSHSFCRIVDKKRKEKTFFCSKWKSKLLMRFSRWRRSINTLTSSMRNVLRLICLFICSIFALMVRFFALFLLCPLAIEFNQENSGTSWFYFND